MRPWTVALVVGALVAATAVVWLLFREADQPVEVLPDGAVVKLSGVTYGKRHRMISGTIGQRMAGRILPRSLARRWSIPAMDHITTNDSLVVWLEMDTRAVPVTLLYAGPSVAIGDEHGSEFPSVVRTGSRTTANGLIQGYEMPIVPPGDNALTIIVRQATGGAATDARFRLRRPAAESRRFAGPSQLSATSQVDNLNLVVRSLESFQTSPSIMYPRTRADCLILEDGRPTTNWTVRMVDVLDAAGRVYRNLTGGDRNGRIGLAVGLSTNQIWRLRFFLGRTNGFTSEDLVNVSDVPLTVSGRAAFRPVTNAVNGGNFVLYDISGFGTCGLTALIPPADDPFDVTFLRAADDEGRELVWGGQASGYVLRDNSSMFNFTVKTTLESETADLTFAVTRMKSVEAFVKPTAATNDASAFLPRSK